MTLVNHFDEVLRNYQKAVLIGAYDRPPDGLFGKFDNVRRFWEDAVLRKSLRDFLKPFLHYKRSQFSRLRIIDLGCGPGAGYDLLTSPHRGGPIVFDEAMISVYKGVDISPDMIAKAQERYQGNPKCCFVIADLNDGLPLDDHEPPYDLYFSSYGSLSHLPDESLRRLLGEICAHMGERAVFVADVLGRFSYEWQCYWDEPEDGQRMRTYSMSYLYPPELREQMTERFPIRFWGGEELDRFITETVEHCGVKIVRKELRDRSILVGRHMDTGEFNPYAQPIRSVVNSLFEPNRRTDLTQLLFDYRPHPLHPDLNNFFERFQLAWNAVVAAALDELHCSHYTAWLGVESALEPLPEPVHQAIHMVRTSIRHSHLFCFDDPIANFVEPQLAYALRQLEQSLQQGLGCGHSLLAFYEFRKP
ncbi:MAG: hypothetical protein YYHSYBAR_002479 [Candidatus Fervidibacter sacchari]